MFYETLKEICTKKKTSPSKVCADIGISKSNVTKWKAGKMPKLSVVLQIAKHLGINPAKLIPKE